ncbi:MAG: hypothetical protein GY760_21545 [Deltaproteobacteria bacterium]|nr:hypothetical protein [Deltaproteobacteria bacterium]
MDTLKSFLILFFIVSLFSCSMMMMDEVPPPANTNPARLLLIVDQDKITDLSDKTLEYSNDIISTGGAVETLPFPPDGSVEDMKNLIKTYRDSIDGVFLVGDLPTAWYEQTAFSKYENFPVDIFLMDLDAAWTDSDNNGIYDGHGSLNLTLFASRIVGTVTEINAYFTKLHNYRSMDYEYLGRAFIFKDDDWFDTYRSSTFGLERLYENVKINENAELTMKDNYLYQLSYTGADYVYQWIHATPTSLYISNDGYYSTVRYSEIKNNNMRGRFLNMFNCKGARYTQRNLGMTYLTNTETGLAVTGSTKVGGNYYPLEFHRTLTVGSNWGNAFISWYNFYGKKDDSWFLGMTILGDPALHIKDSDVDRSLSRASFKAIIPPSEEEINSIAKDLTDFEDTL